MTTPPPAEADPGAETFAAERPRLVGIAYRMLGSWSDAEDVVQEAWIRWAAQGAGAERIERPAAWLTTVVTRARHRPPPCDRPPPGVLRRALPPRADRDPPPRSSGTTALSQSLTLGFLVLLDRCTVAERAVLLLADVFRVPFAEIAVTMQRSEAACRQLATRARRKVARPWRPGRAGRPGPARPAPRRAGGRGPVVPRRAARPRRRVGLRRRRQPARRQAPRRRLGPGQPAPHQPLTACRGPRRPLVRRERGARARLLGRRGDEADLVVQADVRRGLAVGIWIVTNPDKLHQLPAVR